MKNLYLFFSLIFSVTFAFSQTSPINPSSAIIGGPTSSLPSNWSGTYLGIFKNGSSIPTFRIGNSNTHMSIAVANNPGQYGAITSNDIIHTISQTNHLIFNINTSNEFNTRKIMFGTVQNGFKTLVVSNGDKVGIGTKTFPSNDPNYKLYVKGGIKAQQVKVELCSGWCDYVFDKSYDLTPLNEVKSFIQANKHLPDFPSAETLEKEEGFELGKMTTLQQEKIEELFLYVIEINDQLTELKKENEALKKKMIQWSK